MSSGSTRANPSSKPWKDRPFIHAHIALCDRDFQAGGGHLKEAVVSATCEIILTRFQETIRRRVDPGTGLKTIALELE